LRLAQESFPAKNFFALRGAVKPAPLRVVLMTAIDSHWKSDRHEQPMTPFPRFALRTLPALFLSLGCLAATVQAAEAVRYR
ncbi:hypothetical protein, partial [Salmonella sp. E393-2]|uniref:hypothetical protein n=1 Tax=Salmonella sp. E393-2 TaxID=3240324 RepID=UPI00352BAD84